MGSFFRRPKPQPQPKPSGIMALWLQCIVPNKGFIITILLLTCVMVILMYSSEQRFTITILLLTGIMITMYSSEQRIHYHDPSVNLHYGYNV